jgi:hypothetical protein
MLLANEFANAGIEPDDYRRWRFGCPDCAIAWMLSISRLMITCCN